MVRGLDTGNTSAHSSANVKHDDERVVLQGSVERIIFHNADNGFTILRILPRSDAHENAPKADPYVAKGYVLNPQAGVLVRMEGTWVHDARYGRQFQMHMCDEVLPASTEGIRLYLGSGLIKGVGEVVAGKIVEKFGEDTIRILDEEPEKILSVPKIGKKKLSSIIQGWAEHRGVRDLMMFLQPYGITANLAVRIYKHYGPEALEIVKQNPYRLAMDVRGIGFVSADNAAQKLGFSKDNALRAQAGVLYTLDKCNEKGHVYMPRDALLTLTSDELEISYDLVENALAELEAEERIVHEELGGEEGIFLQKFFHYESKTAFYLKRLLASPKSVHFENAADTVKSVLAQLPLALAEAQEKAIHTAATSKLMVLTGGPGTGKTTIIKAIIDAFHSVDAKILLAAPTGRAAKRMSEATNREAKTIHRLLEFNPGEDGFARNEDNPLACSLLIIDEASMMDIFLFYHLLKATPLGATMIFVGDVHQLPSVGPGNVLNDIIASQGLPVVELTEIFRQSSHSKIVYNAHLINKGQVPNLESSKERLSDFYFIHAKDPESVANLIVSLVTERVPQRFGYDAVNDIQVLVPMHRGEAGSENLNKRLQEVLIASNAPSIQRGKKVFRLGDKVMQTRNNYEKDVFNGDIGTVILLDGKDRTLTVRIDDRNIPYEFDELDDIVPAYAISIHKSQGSEYPVVIIPLLMQHYMLLQRNLVYTGVTRGKKLVILVGESRALKMAIANNNTVKRHTRLQERLRYM